MSNRVEFVEEDGAYVLTESGNTAVMFLLYLAIIAVAVNIGLFMRKTGENTGEKKGRSFTTKQLVFAGVALAVAFPLSYIKIIHMPWGGSVTLCSMLFVSLIGYWFGPSIGLTAAFAYSLLQFIQGGSSYMLSPLQVMLDYIFAFTALGISGFFHKKKNGLLIGYLAAVFCRGVFHSIGGYLYWMDYMPDNFPQSLSALYPIAYNFAYLLPEAVLTVIIISLPPVKKALTQLTKEAA